MAGSTTTARRIDSIKDEIDELKKKLTLLGKDYLEDTGKSSTFLYRRGQEGSL